MGDETPLVSVIVPVYNVRQYLCECVQSLTSQTYGNLEIILVDDGSTDGSGELCDDLRKNDSRILVLHKENGGLSDARNIGLSHSNGEWVSFVDSDDFVSPVFIEALLNAALSTNCGIATIPMIKRFQDGTNCALVQTLDEVCAPLRMTSKDVQRLMLYQVMDTAAQNRLYSRDSLGNSPFPKGFYYEDLACVYRIIHDVESVAVVECAALYGYRQRSSSILHQRYCHKKAESALQISNQLYLDVSAWYPDLTTAVSSRCFSLCRMVFAQIPSGDEMNAEYERDRDDLWQVIRSFRSIVVGDSYARKRERLAAVIACMGRLPFSAFCRFCRLTGLMR